MWVREKVLPAIVSVAVVSATTAILWYAKLVAAGAHQLVYFYLLPVALIAFLFSGRLAIWCAGIAIICADYFLQDPLYTLYNTNPLEYGDLIWLAMLAALAIKCTRKLMRPSGRTVGQLGVGCSAPPVHLSASSGRGSAGVR
jgi:K+-sensing histidine kinase KdpD